MKCTNNLKQWALAHHGYHDVMGSFIKGSTNTPRQTWVMFLWPYIEQTSLANLNNYNEQFYNAPGTIVNTMNGLCAQHVSQYLCPSDVGSIDQNVGTYQRTRGNYVVNWGNAYYDNPPPTNGKAPFWHTNGNRATPGKTTMASITDGTSNTLLMSEYLIAKSPQDNDWRGDIHNDDGVFRFHTLLTPNTSSPDLIASGWYQVTGDPLMPATTASGNQQANAARSRHTGGVNASLCDGSVRFFNNTINLINWMALGTMDGNEVIPGDL